MNDSVDKCDALDAINKFWPAMDLLNDRGPIVADLMHGHEEFLFRGLSVCKFVQIVTGRRIVGLVGNPGVVPSSSPVDIDRNTALGRAFGLSEVVIVPQNDALCQLDTSALKAISYGRPDGARFTEDELSQFLEFQTADGFLLGRTIQETYMRAELRATLCHGSRLREIIDQVASIDTWFESLIGRLQPSVFVSGHIDYSPWGHLAERLVRTGGRSIYYRCDARTPLYIIDDLTPAGTLNGILRESDCAAFGAFEAALRQNGAAARAFDCAASRLNDASRGGSSRHWRWVSEPPAMSGQCGATGEARGSEDARSERNRRLSYMLFAHTFTDQPCADRSLFLDHLRWVEATLKHAAECGLFDITVKWHPYDRSYDKSNMSDELERQFAEHSNIKFLRDGLNHEDILAGFDAGVTVRGTPGVQMTALGLPMILAGDGPYSNLGFCLQPKSQTEYFSMLDTGAALEFDIGEASRRARLFHAFDRFWSAPASPLCPPYTALAVDQAWAYLQASFKGADLLTDPMLLAMSHAWGARNVRVISADLYPSIRRLGTYSECIDA